MLVWCLAGRGKRVVIPANGFVIVLWQWCCVREEGHAAEIHHVVAVLGFLGEVTYPAELARHITSHFPKHIAHLIYLTFLI